MQFTLKQLDQLITVAEHGSVSSAARELFISQPTLSSSIARLEQSLGLTLLIRHHARGVSLTPTGADFLVRARSLVDPAQEIEADVRELRDSVSGAISIGCFVTLAPFFLPRLISRLKEEYRLTLFFTEHDMQMVFDLAERISVLHQGRLIASGSPEEIRRDEQVRRIYLGKGD